MKTIIVKTQAEFDAAKTKKNAIIEIRSETDDTISVYPCHDSSTVRAYGSSTVRAYGSSTVRACGSSTVRACGSSTVRAYGSSTVTACDSSTVTACGSSTVRACGSSTVRAYGSSTVTACDSSTVTACGSSTVRAYGSSTVTACDSSTVTACGSSTVRACGSSTVRAYGSSTVTACDSSTVTACGSSTVRAYGSSTVTAYGSSTVTAYGSSTVRAYGFAIVALACLSLGWSIEAFNNNVVQIHWNSEGKIKWATEIKMTPIDPSLDSFKKHYPTETKENGKMRWYKTVRKTEGGKFVANYDKKFEYRIGEIAKENVEFDPNNTCGAGIHVSGKQWALDFGKNWDDCALLELEVDPEKIFVSSDTDGKVRCSECLVVREVPKDEWYA